MQSDRSESSSANPAERRPRLGLAGFIGLSLVVVVVVAGVSSRHAEDRDLNQWAREQAVPTVVVAAPDASGTALPLLLPGQLQALINAPIYARTNGYLKSWKKDIGAHVKAGELLGEIDTPDLDQQLLQAKADLASAKANSALAGTTAKRWQAMLGSDSVARQEVDEKTGDYAAKQALTNAAQANLDRIVALKAFARVVAPFDGTVTARNTDVGALINASGGGSALFEVSDTSKLRVYVRVPQAFAPSLHRGDTADLTVPEYPDRVFKASIDADARTINAGSGTTLVQLLVDNSDRALMPGAYASVKFQLPATAQGLRLPADALVFNSDGLRVATVGPDNKVHFKTVTIQRDFGKSVELGAGLQATDRVIQSPPDGLADGDAVHIASNVKTVAANEKP